MKIHDATYQRLKSGLLPIFTGIITYSQQLQQCLEKSSGVELNFIDYMLKWTHDSYPEWVFKQGFNRQLRGGFRYLLVEFDIVLDAFISIEYHLQQLTGNDLLQEVAKALCDTVNTNIILLKVIHDFFADIKVDLSFHNLTSDVTEIYNSLGGVLPPSLDLLSLSSDYVHLASLVRAMVDMRRVLLNIIAALPIDDMVAQE